MIISVDTLRRDTIKLINQIDKQIKEVEEFAQGLGIPPEKVRDTTGNWVMSPLLLAKVQAYASLIQLQAKK